jgi:hypothetical protein
MSAEGSRPSTAGSQRGPESRPSTAGSQRGPESRASTPDPSESQPMIYGQWIAWSDPGWNEHNPQQGVGGQDQEGNTEDRVRRQREIDLEAIKELEKVLGRTESVNQEPSSSRSEGSQWPQIHRNEEEARTALFKWREDALKKQNEEKDNK